MEFADLLRAPNVRHVSRQTERTRARSVLKESAGRTLEVVPPFERLHTTERRAQICQLTIAGRTAQRGRRHIGISRDRRRSYRAAASFARYARFLTHACDGATVSPH